LHEAVGWMLVTSVCKLSLYVCVGVRSLNFIDSLLTIGTGAGAVYFFDRRANKYLEMSCGHSCSLNVGAGWLVCITLTHSALYINMSVWSHKHCGWSVMA